MNLYLTRDWRAIPAHDSFGHDVETAYLLIEAAEALGLADDPGTWQVPRLLVDHALEWGWDDEHGGFYDKGESFSGEAFDRKKVWWTQAEGLNALLLMHEKFKGSTDRYGKAFWKQWSFIEKHMIDPLQRRLVRRDDTRRQADRRRRESQPVESQLPYVASPDECRPDARDNQRSARRIRGTATKP